ncbi:MAG: hypothetical protein Kapaf2KO_09260 [Candidatus Kapaibacteriales bacterium]
MSKRLDREELEGMIPDYVFNRLNENDRLLFESEVIDFPDLENEVKVLSQAFSKTDLDTLDRFYINKSSNISVTVSEKLSNNSSLSNILNSLSFKLATAISVLTIFSFFVFGPDFSGDVNGEIFTDDDIESILDGTEASTLYMPIGTFNPIQVVSGTIHVVDEDLDLEDKRSSLDSKAKELLDAYQNDKIEYQIDELLESEEEFEAMYGDV